MQIHNPEFGGTRGTEVYSWEQYSHTKFPGRLGRPSHFIYLKYVPLHECETWKVSKAVSH